MKLARLVLLLFIFSVLIAPGARSFGFVRSVENENAEPGDLVQFKFYVLTQNDSVVMQEVEAPNGWVVDVYPKEITPSSDNYRYIEDEGGYRKAFPVKCDVYLPEKTKAGQQQVKVSFVQKNILDTQTDLDVKQVQDFTFKINVSGDFGKKINSTEASDEHSGSKNITDKETERSKNDDYNWVLILFLIFQPIWIGVVYKLVT